jgi:hypothetical protein
MSQVVIQHITTVWTKQSRGGIAARQRNSVPSAFTIPAHGGGEPFMLHRLTFAEHVGFNPQSSILTANNFSELKLVDLSYSISDGTQAVRFHRDGDNAAKGSPRPSSDAFVLEEQNWGRIVYNGRYIDRCTGNWSYEKHVYNIGWFSKWNLNVFCDSAPHAVFEELSMLR